MSGHGATTASTPSNTGSAISSAEQLILREIAAACWKARNVGSARSTNAPAHNATVPMSILVRALVVLLCVAGFSAAFISRQSRLIQADVFVQFVKDQNKQRALDRLDDATRLNPESSIEIARARLVPPQQGVKLLQKAVNREPENAVLWVRLAQHQRNAGDGAAAQRSYARARELDSQLPPEGPPPGN